MGHCRLQAEAQLDTRPVQRSEAAGVKWIGHRGCPLGPPKRQTNHGSLPAATGSTRTPKFKREILFTRRARRTDCK